MKLTKVNVEEMKNYKKNKVDAVLDEFISMNVPAVEVTEYTNKSAYSCYTSLYNGIQRRKSNTIGVRVSNGRVFLYNKLLMQEHKED